MPASRIALFKLPENIEAERARFAGEDRAALDGTGVEVSLPADAHSLAAWDICWLLQANNLESLESTLSEPAFRSAWQAANERALVIKAWSFE